MGVLVTRLERATGAAVGDGSATGWVGTLVAGSTGDGVAAETGVSVATVTVGEAVNWDGAATSWGEFNHHRPLAPMANKTSTMGHHGAEGGCCCACFTRFRLAIGAGYSSSGFCF